MKKTGATFVYTPPRSADPISTSSWWSSCVPWGRSKKTAKKAPPVKLDVLLAIAQKELTGAKDEKEKFLRGLVPLQRAGKDVGRDKNNLEALARHNTKVANAETNVATIRSGINKTEDVEMVQRQLEVNRQVAEATQASMKGIDVEKVRKEVDETTDIMEEAEELRNEIVDAVKGFSAHEAYVDEDEGREQLDAEFARMSVDEHHFSDDNEEAVSERVTDESLTGRFKKLVNRDAGSEDEATESLLGKKKAAPVVAGKKTQRQAQYA